MVIQETKLKQKVTKAGQHFISSGYCIATSRLNGTPCGNRAHDKAVPYCCEHMLKGDPAFRVVNHPRAGKILVAARDLPAGYRATLWGKLIREKDLPPKSLEWSFQVANKWYVDPTKSAGSLVQFCPCPGPSEVAAVTTSGEERRGKEFGSRSFMLNTGLPKGWQVTMQYGNNSKESNTFFEERGIARVDVGTACHPALRRVGAAPVRRKATG
mmetsp:Transcript_37973/g.107320  ORF Transcript_37973/g.107320 Transcript_37973/m.107320 type:complete len:213 (+) Transcript_37973:41-679(+)